MDGAGVIRAQEGDEPVDQRLVVGDELPLGAPDLGPPERVEPGAP